MSDPLAPARRVLLLRRGLAFIEPGERVTAPDELRMRAATLELAAYNRAPSRPLLMRLACLPDAAFRHELYALGAVLAADLGGGVAHVPLFRKFPNDVPADTRKLWWTKVLVHYLQGVDQPCLFCDGVGTTHVLYPCEHVVCDRCFDGTSYSACPVCEHHVDRGSPFFGPDQAPVHLDDVPRRAQRRLDLGEDLEAAACAYFGQLCARTQALSKDDEADLAALIQAFGATVLGWLPEKIPLRENVARVFGALARGGDPVATLGAAAAHMRTATDMLRFLAAYSGADPSLTPVKARARRKGDPEAGRRVCRFRVAKLSRPLRRAVLAWLEGLPADALVEDMQRRAAWWVWLGEFLHPHEHADRHPNVARAFAVVRRFAPDGTKVPPHRNHASRVEAAIAALDVDALLPLLTARPGEFARRLDHVLRALSGDPAAAERVLASFAGLAPRMATPVLVTLAAHLPRRTGFSPIRVFWPKGDVAKGFHAGDWRTPLSPEVAAAAIGIVEAELLDRFAALPPYATAVVDTALADVPVPFNARTAAKGAIALPRGACVPLDTLGGGDDAGVLRLFLHWCQPDGGRATDLDLSVAFYDADWLYQGVCSYYQLSFTAEGGRATVARSAGDLRDAPPPDGASEFVDVDRAAARAAGLRYAVAVVNAYAGLPFDQLERAFAGLMVRRTGQGPHFDPQAVALRFDLEGGHGVYLPFVVDLEADTLHWLDMHRQGEYEFNNVAKAKHQIAALCPELLAYFGAGTRPTMADLAIFHAAARAEVVLLRRRDGLLLRVARDGDAPAAFLARLRSGVGMPVADVPDGAPAFAALFTGDLALPAGSDVFSLVPGLTTATLAAADLLAARPAAGALA